MNHYRTLSTALSKLDDDSYHRNRQLAAREADLNTLARDGYVLTGTLTIEGAERLTIVDTLSRTNQ